MVISKADKGAEIKKSTQNEKPVSFKVIAALLSLSEVFCSLIRL